MGAAVAAMRLSRTPYEIQTNDTILFIEDVAEPAYRIDRMLMHLKFAGKLDGVHGIIFGEMLDCARGAAGYTLQEVVLRVVGDLGIPVVYGLHSGHVTRRNITIPLGVAAQLDAGAKVVLGHASAARTNAQQLQYPNDETDARPFNRHMRYGYGLAGRNAAAAWLSRDWL